MKRSAFVAAACLLTASAFIPAPRVQAQSADMQAITTLENNFSAAVKARDIDAVMKLYVPGNELVVFDVSPPREYVGFEAYKKDWQSFFDSVKGLRIDVTELNITADGTLAYSRSIQHVTGTGSNGAPIEFNARVTDCYRKVNGTWLISLEHVSVPADLATGKADLMSKP